MISVIIPAYNEAKTILRTLDHLNSLEGDFEIVVVDGGSDDTTYTLVSKYSSKKQLTLLSHPEGTRASSMNFGAKKAQGNWYLFLHADSMLTSNSLLAIEKLPTDTIAGAFSLKFDNPHWFYYFAAQYSRLRSRIFKMMHGDQGIFVRENVFDAIGGYQDVILMEDVLFSRAVRKQGKTQILKQTIITSARRLEGYGKVKSTLRYFLIKFLFIFGVSPSKLDKIYRSQVKS